MDIDDDEYSSSAKIEELPDDAFVQPALSSRDGAYIVQSDSEGNSSHVTDDSMEDIETFYPVRLPSSSIIFSLKDNKLYKTL
jgi:hypothetical protein